MDTPTARSGRIKVGIVDFVISSDESTLTTSGLGPCISVALYDPETGVSGLAHTMLPETDDDGELVEFVGTDIELLIAKMQAVGVSADRIAAKIAGGNTVFDFTSANGDGSVGNRNVTATRTTLDGFGIGVITEDVGGSHDRPLEFDGETDDLRVRSAKNGTRAL